MSQRRTPIIRHTLASPLTAIALALRSLPFGLALVGVIAAPNALAADAVPAAVARKAYAVPSGPLGSAIAEFASQAGVTVGIDSRLVEGLSTPGIRGNFSVDEGFASLLKGSNLESVENARGVFLVRPRAGAGVADDAATLPAVNVAGAAIVEDQSPLHLKKIAAAGALGDRSQLETPFSTAVVTAQQLESHQINSVAEAFAADPSVSSQNPIYTIWGTDLTVRGLDLDTQNGYKINGLPVYAEGLDVPYEQLESIQLLKGLSGFMYGFGAPGGIANFVTKKPSEDAVRSIDVGYRTDNIWSEHVDLGNSYGASDPFGYRINATHEEGKTYNGGQVRRDAVSLGLAAHLSPDLSWSFDLMHHDRHTTGEVSALSTSSYVGTQLPTAIAGDAHLATNGTYNDTSLTVASTGLEYKINPDWTLSGRYGYSDVKTTYVKDFNYLNGSSGNYDVYLLGGRQRFINNVMQAMLQGRVVTGALTHQLVFGLEQQRLDTDSAANGFFNNVGTGNLYQANTNSYSDNPDWQMYRTGEYRQNSAFVSDTISLASQWSAIIGLRYTNYEQTGWNSTGATTSQYEKNGVITPTLALMYKPVDYVTVYSSYVESLEAGGIVGSTYANANAMLKPLKSKQYELGSKAETDRWSASAALFRIERAAAYANSDNVYVQNGLTVYQGVELNGSIKPAKNLTVGSGLMLLHPEYEHGSDYDGKRVAAAPKLVATAYTNYDVAQLPGLSVHVNAKFIGSTYLDGANTLEVGGRTLFGMGGSYRSHLGAYAVTYRAEITNLTNRHGWVAQADSQVVPILTRAIALNAKLEF